MRVYGDKTSFNAARCSPVNVFMVLFIPTAAPSRVRVKLESSFNFFSANAKNKECGYYTFPVIPINIFKIKDAAILYLLS